MKRFAPYILLLLLLLLGIMLCACNDELDIRQDYSYRVETLPLPKKLGNGESVALEFSILSEGNYSETAYKFRYFQSEGTGILTCKGQAVPMNRFQGIASDDFVLTYQSACEEQQQLDFVFENNFGRRVEYMITFTGKRTEEKTEESLP
ncbi:hypothetical protein EZS27_024853 [termite gut metagenome]|uniref:DUF3872 domain-containing protein n=1 Tax=termite gut metagenome TaxID=433724 RepID=A0A5J4QWT7_9ZZZZ